MSRPHHGKNTRHGPIYNPKDDISDLKLKIKKLKDRLAALHECVTQGNRDAHILARSNRLKIMAKIESVDEFAKYSTASKNQLLDIAMSYLGRDMDPDLFNFVSRTDREMLKTLKKTTRSHKTGPNIVALYYFEDKLYRKAKEKRKALEGVGSLSEPLQYLLPDEKVQLYEKNRRELINQVKLDDNVEVAAEDEKKKIKDLAEQYKNWCDKLSAIHILKTNMSRTGVKGQKKRTESMVPNQKEQLREAERAFLLDEQNDSFVTSLLKDNGEWGTSWVRVQSDEPENVRSLNEFAQANLRKALRCAAKNTGSDTEQIKLKAKDFEKCGIPFLFCDMKIAVEGLGVFQPDSTNAGKIIEIQKSKYDTVAQALTKELSKYFFSANAGKTPEFIPNTPGA